MSQLKSTHLPTTMAVLGVVIERPNQTGSEIARAVSERFVGAGIGGSAPYGALRTLAKGPSPRVRCIKDVPGSEPATDRYDATERGLAVFERWMFSPPTAVPAIREAMYGRIELARLRDLPGLIRLTREEELIADDLYAAASSRVRRTRRKNRLGRTTSADFDRAIREVWILVDPLWWSSRAAIFLAVRENLEEIAEEAGVEFRVPAKPRMAFGGTGVV
jgi:DNA-binding PadR family transcriptional regulator